MIGRSCLRDQADLVPQIISKPPSLTPPVEQGFWFLHVSELDLSLPQRLSSRVQVRMGPFPVQVAQGRLGLSQLSRKSTTPAAQGRARLPPSSHVGQPRWPSLAHPTYGGWTDGHGEQGGQASRWHDGVAQDLMGYTAWV